jgi:hypothetical protein
MRQIAEDEVDGRSGKLVGDAGLRVESWARTQGCGKRTEGCGGGGSEAGEVDWGRMRSTSGGGGAQARR